MKGYKYKQFGQWCKTYRNVSLIPPELSDATFSLKASVTSIDQSSSFLIKRLRLVLSDFWEMFLEVNWLLPKDCNSKY